MLPRRKISRSSAGPDPTLLRPPNLRTVGAVPFTRQDRDALEAWLAEGGWPPGRMDIATLEGYLVALLVWPVGLPAGAWLPPIWAERSGWRVPAKIASPEAYEKFIGLVIGFLQELDGRLGACPPSFVPALSETEPATRGHRPPPGISWAQGFLQALQQNSQGLTWRSAAARSAVARIASFASYSATATSPGINVAAELNAAVLTLVAERATRGPLGALEARRPVPVVPNEVAPAVSHVSSQRRKTHP
ncbi:MAG: YecA family protein [Gammaproteobacteria bacterium]